MYVGIVYSDCSTAYDTLRCHYNKLLNLSVETLLPELFTYEVVTFDEKQTIKTIAVEKDKRAYILDIILSSLKCDQHVKYNGFLKAMQESKDLVMRQWADKLGKLTR